MLVGVLLLDMFTHQHRRQHDLGVALDVLGSYRRRVVLAELSDRAEPVHRDTLAEAVVATERDIARETAPEEAVERAAIRLHHVDLPRLEAADLLHYDHVSERVEANDLPLVGEEWLEMPVVEALESWAGP